MSLSKVAIDDLAVGMFVVDMDISWMKSPFFRHKRMIEKEHDIALLRKAGVTLVTIDVAKSRINRVKPAAPVQDAPTNAVQVHSISPAEIETEPLIPEDQSSPVASVSFDFDQVRSKATNGPRVMLKEEIKAAKQLQGEILARIDAINAALESGEPLSPRAVSPLVARTVLSIQNNNQAMMALLHEGRGSGKIASHGFGVFALLLMLGEAFEMSEHDLELLGLTALVHDAGWLRLPGNLFSKGRAYAPHEKKLVDQHISLAKSMLEKQSIDSRVIKTVSEHHELLDGSGFPKGMMGDELDAFARLLAVCNEYDEMVHGLGEHPGMTPQTALSDLYKQAQVGKLDQIVVAKLVSLLGVYPMGSAVTLNDSSIGLVVELHHTAPMSPTIRLLYDENRELLSRPKIVDLRDEKRLNVSRVLDVLHADKYLDPARKLIFSSDLLCE